MAKSIIIIGGGITGLSAAWELAKSGNSVTLLEKARIAAMASGWTLAGVRQSGRDSRELPLAMASIRLWQDFSERLRGETGYRRKGNLRFARDAAEVPVIRQLVEEQRRLGLEIDYLEGAASIRRIAPAAAEQGIVSASFCPSDGQAEPALTLSSLAAAAGRAGADVRTGVEALKIAVRGGRAAGVETSQGFLPADCVVAAAGIHTPELLAPLGLSLPLSIQYVAAVQTAPSPVTFDQVFGVANADIAGRQEISGAFRFTSGISAWQSPSGGWTEALLKPSQRQVETTVSLAGKIVPAILDAPVARTWGGLIDLTPDDLPVIDAPPEVPGLVIAAGYSGHGFALGPVSGELIADLATGRRPQLDLSHFRLARFRAAGQQEAKLALHG